MITPRQSRYDVSRCQAFPPPGASRGPPDRGRSESRGERQEGPLAAGNGELLIRGATLLDGSGAPPLPDAALLVQRGRVAYAGPAPGLPPHPAAPTLEAAGRFVVPGLIDLHTHSTFESELRAYLQNGVTTIRYAGLDLDTVAALRVRVERGEIPGPRLLTCGPMLDAPPPAFPEWTIVASSPDEARQVARWLLAEQRVDALIATQRITPDLLRPIVSTAHAFGRPVVGQLWATDARQAAEIGIDQLDNNSRVVASRQYPPERLLQYRSISERLGLLARAWVAVDWDLTRLLMEAMVRHGVAYCPTLVVTRARLGLGLDELERDPDYRSLFGDQERQAWARFQRRVAGGWSAEDRALLREALERRQEWLARFHALGGTLLAGTDMQCGGIMLHHELRHLAAAGLSPLEVVAAATGQAARWARLDEQLGTLRPGRLADLLLLDGDPLEDLGALRHPLLVIKGGQVTHRRDGAPDIGCAKGGNADAAL